MTGKEESAAVLRSTQDKLQLQAEKNLSVKNLQEQMRKISLLALDVDGVLTDGSICISPAGEVFKAFNAKDGMGISCALRAHLRIAVITGRQSPLVARRCEELGITLFLQGVQDKRAALAKLAHELGLSRDEIAYMGDDLNDLPAFAAAGLRVAPADAAMEVLARADFITCAGGGRGAVRELVTMILGAQDKWAAIVDSYLEAGQGDRQ